MGSDARCKNCGAELASDASPDGHCPGCLLKFALATAESGDGPEEAGFSELPSTRTASEPGVDSSTRIGPYRILQKLGEGGMGEVFLAEQSEPVRRRVALKLIKLGMDSKQVIARFESERQALALMDHPAIATVLDAGTTDQGRPYFAMEYVEGEPITKYCDRLRLTTAERLKLFIRVCEGVQHAHQKGVIHRDLKPSNVLVKIEDRTPVPKIIDFGVAKATQHRLTERSVFTQLGVLIGTPEYMSPEQAEMTTLDVDTRTDVYSLGVMLYELLAGALPFDTKELRQVGFDELRRRIREEEPSKPSTRISTLEQEKASRAADRRGVDVAALRRVLRGDLDWVTMRALEKDRTRRYQSPAELAADLGRHLADEPVHAGPPSTVYRAKKFARRHRVGVVLAITLALITAASAVGLALQGRRIARERDRANQEALAAQRVSDYLTNMLGGVDQYRLGRGLESILQERLEASLREENLSTEETELVLSSFADVMDRIGATDAAIELLDKEIMARAAETLDEKLGDDPLILARIHHILGGTYRKLARYEPAEFHALEAVEIRRGVLGEDAPETLRSRWMLAKIYRHEGRYDDADPVFRDTIDRQRDILGENHRHTIESMIDFGWNLLRATRYDEATVVFAQALASSRRAYGESHPLTLNTMNALGGAYRNAGHSEQALAILEEMAGARAASDGLESEDDDGSEWTKTPSLLNLANAYTSVGRIDEAVAILEEDLAQTARVRGEDHNRTLFSMYSLAWAYTLQGKFPEGIELGLNVLEKRRKVLGPDHPQTLVSQIQLVSIYTRAGRAGAAQSLAEDAVSRCRAVHGDVHKRTLAAISRLSICYKQQQEYEKQEAVVREALDIHRQLDGAEHPRTLQAMHNLGLNLFRQDRYGEGIPVLQEALDKRRSALGDADKNTLWTISVLSQSLLFEDRCEEAVVLSREGLQLIARDHGGTHGGKSWLIEVLVNCLNTEELEQGEWELLAEHLSSQGEAAAKPDASSDAKNHYAWELLTTPCRELRDPHAALDFALEANEIDGHSEPWHLDTLALAYHETGDTRRAVEVQKKALSLVASGPSRMRNELEQRLAEFEEALRESRAGSP